MTASAESVLAFWFGDDLESAQAIAARGRLWFGADASFDASIRERFGDLPQRARAGELDAWRHDARSTLALVLILDQFPRNLHRGAAAAFAYDAMALETCEAALKCGFDERLAPIEAFFLYVPFEHAEDLAAQERCVELMRGLCERAPAPLRAQFDSFLSYAMRHRDVIARFGRFPHRNALLERESSREERAYLASGGETFGARGPT